MGVFGQQFGDLGGVALLGVRLPDRRVEVLEGPRRRQLIARLRQRLPQVVPGQRDVEVGQLALGGERCRAIVRDRRLDLSLLVIELCQEVMDVGVAVPEPGRGLGRRAGRFELPGLFFCQSQEVVNLVPIAPGFFQRAVQRFDRRLKATVFDLGAGLLAGGLDLGHFSQGGRRPRWWDRGPGDRAKRSLGAWRVGRGLVLAH